MVPPVKREHYANGWEAGVALARFVMQTQGLNALLLSCLLGWTIYADYRYNAKQEDRTEKLAAKFDKAESAMAEAAADRKHAAESLDAVQRQQQEDRKQFEKFQSDIGPVIQAVKVLLERIERDGTGAYQPTRRYDGGETKGTRQVQGGHEGFGG